MRRFLEEPVILHWDMRQEIDDKQVIASKIMQMSLVKIRFINPSNENDWKCIRDIITIKRDILMFQIEYDFCELDISEKLGKSFLKHVELIPAYRGGKNTEYAINTIRNLHGKANLFQVIFYITDTNFDVSLKIIEALQFMKDVNLSVKLDKENFNSLAKIHELHFVINELSNVYIRLPDINLSFYDDEKIIKDVLALPYYLHGNMFIDRSGKISLYNFLPSYNYGIIDSDILLQDAWKILVKEHSKDLQKIEEQRRYWLKNRMEIDDESIFYRNF